MKALFDFLRFVVSCAFIAILYTIFALFFIVVLAIGVIASIITGIFDALDRWKKKYYNPSKDGTRRSTN